MPKACLRHDGRGIARCRVADHTGPLGRGARSCRDCGVQVPEGFTRLASPEAEIAYRWEPERLEVGQFFAAEVIACRAPGPEAVREVVLDAQMPAHGHGMNYRPFATRLAPDHFRITGLMLHMAGRSRSPSISSRATSAHACRGMWTWKP